MNDFPLFPGLGRSLTDHEVARYLGVDVRLVRKYFARLGGMRLKALRCRLAPRSRHVVSALRLSVSSASIIRASAPAEKPSL